MSEPIRIGDQVIGIGGGWIDMIAEVLEINDVASTFWVHVINSPRNRSFEGARYHARQNLVQRYMP